MPFYSDGSLDDLQKTAFDFTEEMLIGHVVKPLCKALHVAHGAKVLHLDIKPENILVDGNGDAVLIDFGVAKQYDGEGNIIDTRGKRSNSCFAPPELKHGNMVKFGCQSDIYGLAASIYYLLAFPEHPHPVYDFSDQDKDLRKNLADAGCSPKFIDAVVSGLQFSATSRPSNAQAFLNLFPGCEDIAL
jgi:serine/threonine protein kinase